LPAPFGPEQAENLALAHRQRDVAEHGALVIAFGDRDHLEPALGQRLHRRLALGIGGDVMHAEAL
jgi:hypothetical protein